MEIGKDINALLCISERVSMTVVNYFGEVYRRSSFSIEANETRATR